VLSRAGLHGACDRADAYALKAAKTVWRQIQEIVDHESEQRSSALTFEGEVQADDDPATGARRAAVGRLSLEGARRTRARARESDDSSSDTDARVSGEVRCEAPRAGIRRFSRKAFL